MKKNQLKQQNYQLFKFDSNITKQLLAKWKEFINQTKSRTAAEWKSPK